MGKNIVIIGNGAAGHYAAQTIRARDSKCTLTIISDEKYISYYRPRLSHYLGENELGKNFFIKGEEWYFENEIDLLFENGVEKIDVKRKKVSTSKGIDVPYDVLIIANGGRCFMPNMEGNRKAGVFTLKTIEDALSIKEWLKKSQKAVVIGGGLLGLEAAWGIKKTGLDVVINNITDRLMSNQICSQTGEFLGKIVKDKGIGIVLEDKAVRIGGKDDVEYVEFESGRKIETDMVLFSTGIRPSLEIAKDAGIECERGIIVDRQMRTSVDGIFACGDVVQIDGRGFGNWVNAMQMGKVAGANVLGDSVEFKENIPTIILNSFGTSVNCVGETLPGEGYESIIESDDLNNKYKKMFFKNGKVVGGVVIGDAKEYAKIMSDVSRGKKISEYKR